MWVYVLVLAQDFIAILFSFELHNENIYIFMYKKNGRSRKIRWLKLQLFVILKLCHYSWRSCLHPTYMLSALCNSVSQYALALHIVNFGARKIVCKQCFAFLSFPFSWFFSRTLYMAFVRVWVRCVAVYIVKTSGFLSLTLDTSAHTWLVCSKISALMHNSETIRNIHLYTYHCVYVKASPLSFLLVCCQQKRHYNAHTKIMQYKLKKTGNKIKRKVRKMKAKKASHKCFEIFFVLANEYWTRTHTSETNQKACTFNSVYCVKRT